MPSFRTIFLLATAAFASFTYAAPMGEVSSGQLSPVTGATSNGATLPQALNNANPNAGGLGLPVPKPATSNQVVQKRDSTPDSLPVILQALEAKLKGILDELSMYEVFLLSYGYSAMIVQIAPLLRQRSACLFSTNSGTC